MDLQRNNQACLARGNGLSYSDCCTFDQGIIINTDRFRHLLSFDEASGILCCQGGTTFDDLFLAHPDYVPPVLPGTVHATVAGGIANDVHGKNNVSGGTFGQHIVWLEVQTGERVYHCSRNEYPDLFQASIAGLGLTGVITRVAIKMQKSSRYVQVQQEKHHHVKDVVQRMSTEGLRHSYQVAWLDLLNEERALLSFADPCEDRAAEKSRRWTVPPLPFRLINAWNMALFNRYYYRTASTQTRVQSLRAFNNPLDALSNWTRLYGKQGLLQFQAVFPEASAVEVLQALRGIIRSRRATPSLAVLKYFSQPGAGLLSFVQPGFTIAIDFIHNEAARQAIQQMNALIGDVKGKIYLAKDRLLTRAQFIEQYPNQDAFQDIIKQYDCGMQSDLGKRLGLVG